MRTNSLSLSARPVLDRPEERVRGQRSSRERLQFRVSGGEMKTSSGAARFRWSGRGSGDTEGCDWPPPTHADNPPSSGVQPGLVSCLQSNIKSQRSPEVSQRSYGGLLGEESGGSAHRRRLLSPWRLPPRRR